MWGSRCNLELLSEAVSVRTYGSCTQGSIDIYIFILYIYNNTCVCVCVQLQIVKGLRDVIAYVRQVAGAN